MRFRLMLILGVLLIGALNVQRSTTAQEYFYNTVAPDDGTIYAVQWMELLYNRVERERRNVPQAARIYAYAGLPCTRRRASASLTVRRSARR